MLLWIGVAGVLSALRIAFGALAALGWRVGGARSALVCLAFILPIALSGWWDRAMITLYMVFVSVLLALLVGLPLGIFAAARPRRAQRALLLCDTLQTFPSFIYLIPVIMLFGVNDVAVIAAVMVFATVPILRYTIEGLRAVPPELIEAAQAASAASISPAIAVLTQPSGMWRSCGIVPVLLARAFENRRRRAHQS